MARLTQKAKVKLGGHGRGIIVIGSGWEKGAVILKFKHLIALVSG
jgi:hypothetical protein